MATPLKGKDIYSCYFATSAENPAIHKRKECLKEIKQITHKRYTNLVNHVIGSHKDDYFEKTRAFVAENVPP